MRIHSIILLLTFLSLTVRGQDFSNKGTEFWVGYGSHCSMYNANGTVNPTGGAQDMVLYFTSDRNANVTVEIPSIGWTSTYSVAANQVTTSNTIPKITGQDARITDEGKSGKGIHITSDVPIIAYAHIYNASISGATLLFPVNTLAREYYSINYTQISNQAYSYCYSYVIATEDDTNVEIIPSANTILNAKGDTIKVKLNKGEVYNIFGKLITFANPFRGEDLTGTKIRSVATPTSPCKRIAVFSGSGKVSINCNNGSGSADNYMQQSFPANAWGKKYLTAPTKDMPNNFYRIAVSKPGTVVKRNGVVLTGLINGFYYDYQSSTPDLIESDEPIMVAQYITTTGQCGNTFIGGRGDPEMIYLSPIEQTIDKVTINSTPNAGINLHYINIVIHKNGASSLKIDGVSPTPGLDIPHPQANDYLYYQIPLGSGSHTIQSDSGFNAIAYGYGNAETYGYNAGANVKDLYQTLSTNNQFATVKLPATCIGTPFNISITLPYQPLSLEWKLPQFPAIPKINNPAFDSTYQLNGKTIYRYTLIGTYSYNTVGKYNIQVIANNPTVDGCSGEQQIDFDLQVFESPKARFKLVSNNCLSDSILVEDTSSVVTRPITKYMWDLGDGNFTDVKKSFRYKFDTAGKYTIRYFSITDVGCLSDTAKVDFYIDSAPVPDFSVTSLTCIDKDIRFSDSSKASGNSALAEWHWDMGNGTSFVNSTNVPVIAKYSSAQQYTVGLKVKTANGCLSELKTLNFTNHPNPNVSFGLPIVCLPKGEALFTDSTSIIDGSESDFKYAWKFGDLNATAFNPDTSSKASPLHYFTSVGSYNIKLIVTSGNGCVDSLTQALNTIYAQPKVDFNVLQEVCLRESNQFTDLTNPQGRTMQKWRWSFSNGMSDSVMNPLITVAAAGTYTASLFGFTSDGCSSDTVSKTFVVNPLPTPQFRMVNPACETELVTFVQEAIANVGSIKRWNWRLGNDSATQDFTDSNAVVSTTFDNWGDQVIRLMIENTKGCKSDTLIKSFRINPKPKVGFSLPEICLSDAFASFQSSTTLADKTQNMTYEWQFGDPNSSPANPNTGAGISTTHKYSAAAVYSVSLKVTSSVGCVSTLMQSFTVNGATPKAEFAILKPDSLCSNTRVSIQNLSSVDFGSVSKLEIYWDYQNNPTTFIIDENPSANKIYDNLYADFLNQPTKTFTIRLRAFSGGTCVDDELKNITVNGSPQVSIQPLQGICLDAQPRRLNEATFKDVTGIPPGNEIFSGKGVNAIGIFDPSLATTGTHKITYRFTSSKGCFAESNDSIVVWPRPIADFTLSNIKCEKNSITFINRSVANVGNIVTWNWNFGDGSGVRTVNDGSQQTYVYSVYNSYTANLNVITSNGCTSLPKEISIKVNPLPIVKFDLPKVCLPEGKADFANNTDIPDGTSGLLTFKWTYGDPRDPSTTVAKNGNHYYSSLGVYNVTLVATSNNGCIDSLSRQLIDVFPQPKAGFRSLDSVCLGKDIQYFDTSNGFVKPIVEWNWDFDNGANDTQKDPVFEHRASGTYKILHWVKTSEGCISDTAMKQVVIHPYPKISAGPDLFLLDDGQKQIMATATGTELIYNWSPSTYLSAVNVLQPVINQPQQDIVYTLSVTGKGACTITDDVKVTVLKLPKPPNTFTPNGDGINDLWDIQFLDQYPGCILEVYNSQGQLVYRSVGYVKKWDGTSNGKSLPFGTYYYVINPKSGRSKIAGYVTIIK